MARLMSKGPVRDFIYYSVMIGVAFGLTQVMYLYMIGLA